MPSPKVSILMPVYNTSAYLGEAIRSILAQTFTDFELIILDDGSTDQTASVALSFSDGRIRYIKNDRNEGLIFTLNNGADLAKAGWIARMDGDDIAEPSRIERQWNYIEQHPETKVLATRVSLIDEKGEPAGKWKDDEKHTTVDQIMDFLPVNNCIAHPSVMIMTSLLREYRYDHRQLHTEDYDLWLRLAADGISLHKVNEPLLQHRIHTSSVTRKDQGNIFNKLALTKFRFLGKAVRHGKLNSFIVKTFFYALADYFRGIIKSIISR